MAGERNTGTGERDGGLVEDAIERMNRMGSGPSPDLSMGDEEERPKPRQRPRVVKPSVGGGGRAREPERKIPLNEPPEAGIGAGGGGDYDDDDSGDDYGFNGSGGIGGKAGKFAGAGNWMQWGVTALIAIVVCYALISWMTTSKDEIASMADQRIVNAIAPMKTVENTLRTDLDNLEALALTTTKLADYAKKSDLAGLITAASLNGYAKVEELGSYAKTSVLAGYITSSGFAATLEGTTPYKNTARELSDLGSTVVAMGNKVDLLEDSMGDVVDSVGLMDNRVDALEAKGVGSAGVQYSLAGTSTDFRLKVKSPEAGWYVGYVTLVYRTPPALNAANNTYDGALIDFYGKLGDVGTRIYVPKMIASTVWDSVKNKWKVIGWKLGEVSFFTGRFQLVAGTEKELALHIGGMNAFPGYEAYIDILKSSVSSSETGGGSI